MPDPIKSAMEHLKSKGFECKDILGKGTYGTVLKVISKDGTTEAAKIVENRIVNKLELEEWKKFSHQSILSLINVLHEAEGVFIFLTELMDTNLFVLLQEKGFKKDPQGPNRCRSFARQTLSGLAYLHSLRLCHLDLRAENIFVASNDRVVVADFSGLAYAHEMKRFCPLPQSLRPPEMLLNKKTKVAPMPIDLWAYGLLVSHMFLGKGYYILTVKNPKSGHIEAVHQYTECFKSIKYIKPFIRQNYPNSKLLEEQYQDFIDFVSSFLQINPISRLPATDGLRHSFLNTPVLKVSSVMMPEMQQASTSDAVTPQESSVALREVYVKFVSQNQETDVEKGAVAKSKKLTWAKYKANFENIRKLYTSSPPLFRSRKSRLERKRESKKNESNESVHKI